MPKRLLLFPQRNLDGANERGHPRDLRFGAPRLYHAKVNIGAIREPDMTKAATRSQRSPLGAIFANWGLVTPKDWVV